MTKPQDSEAWAKLKRLVGGKPLRVFVGAWIADHDGAHFSQQEIAEGVDYSAGAISAELRGTFVREGLLLKANDRGPNGVQFYTRLDSPWWDAFRVLRLAAAAGPALAAGPRLDLKDGGRQGRQMDEGESG